MVRKAAYIGSAYFLGLIFASFLNSDLILLIIIAFVLALLFIAIKKYRKEILLCFVSFLIGVSVIIIYKIFFYNKIKLLSGQNISLSGIITDISDERSDMRSYTVKTKINGIRCYVIMYTKSLECGYFDKITFEGNLTEFENSYLFNTKDFNESRNIIYNITSPQDIKIVKKISILKYILNYRDYICNKISGFLPNEEGGFLNAMLSGDKTGVDSDLKVMMYRSGIGHIMAVSGVHFSIMAALLLFFTEKLKLSKKTGYFILFIFSLLFVSFAGFSMSVLRAAVMILIVYAAPLFRRQYDCFSSLGAAVIFLTLLQPYCIKDPSFLLSVSGTFGIGVLAPYVCSYIKRSGKVWSFVKTILSFLCANIAVIPASLIYFDEISIISPLTNLVLVPVCMVALMFLITTVFFGGANFIAFPLITISGLICKPVIFICKVVGDLNFSYISISEKYLLLILLLCFLGIILSYRIFKKYTLPLICTCISAVIIPSSLMVRALTEKDLLTIGYFTNSGYSCVLAVKSGYAVIIDTGSDSKTISMARKFLLQNHVSNISYFNYADNNNDYKKSLYRKYFAVFDDSSYVNNDFILEASENGVKLVFDEFSLILSDERLGYCEESVVVLSSKAIPQFCSRVLITSEAVEGTKSIVGCCEIKCLKNGNMSVRSI